MFKDFYRVVKFFFSRWLTTTHIDLKLIFLKYIYIFQVTPLPVLGAKKNLALWLWDTLKNSDAAGLLYKRDVIGRNMQSVEAV